MTNTILYFFKLNLCKLNYLELKSLSLYIYIKLIESQH